MWAYTQEENDYLSEKNQKRGLDMGTLFLLK